LGATIGGFLDRQTGFGIGVAVMDRISPPPPLALARRALRRPWLDVWPLAALVIAALVLMPVVAVVWMAFNPVENIWPHMLATTLPRYLGNTAVLMGGVAVLTAAVGTGAAWLVTMYRFPGSRVLDIALLAPLAVPAYIGAYALVDLLEYAGPVQSALRATFGWASPRDYWFPPVRSRGAAVLVLSAALYPYVYLLARAAFREQSGNAYEVARALGAGPWGLFWRLGLPLARPAVAAGVALACMETVNEFGAVTHFGVQTLTTGIFSVWLTAGNAGGAAQLALVSLAVILGLMLVERIGRRRSRFHRAARQSRPVVAKPLRRLARGAGGGVVRGAGGLWLCAAGGGDRLARQHQAGVLVCAGPWPGAVELSPAYAERWSRSRAQSTGSARPAPE
jgi:iron(III) transport system permease protein